jgi:hypothetical protein
MHDWGDNQGTIDEAIAHLQEMMLKAVALGQRLPGLEKPIVMPVHCQLRSGRSHALLTDNLSPSLNLHTLPGMLRPVSTAEYQSTSSDIPDSWYLAFQPPQSSPGRIRLVISALRGKPGRKPPPVEIGNLQAEFHFTGSRWEAVAMPSLFISYASPGSASEPI